MKRLTKTILIITALILTCALAGCNPQKPTPSTSPSTAPSVLPSVSAPVEVTVTFISSTNEAVQPQTVPVGGTITLPVLDVSDGFLAGWYLGEQRWTESTPVTEDITLTARIMPFFADGLTFEMTDGGLAVAMVANGLSELIVPETYGNLPVVEVMNGALSENVDFTRLVLPPCVTGVGEDFLSCTKIVEMTLPTHLIGKIGMNSQLLERVVLNAGTEIPATAFMGCSHLDEVVFPSALKKIGNSAFSGCYNLTFVYIPQSVTEIGDFAFANCMKLVEIKNDSSFEFSPLTSGAGELGASALNVYSSTEGQSHLFVVDEYVFVRSDDGTHLSSYTGHDDELVLPTIGEDYKINYRAFFNTGAFTRVTMPEGVTEIGYEAFYGCGDILQFDFPASLAYIDYSAIFNCAYVERATYNGTIEQWNATEKHVNWNLHSYSFPIYCKDGTTYSR